MTHYLTCTLGHNRNVDSAHCFNRHPSHEEPVLKQNAFHEVSHEIITVIAADASQGVLGLHEPINLSLPLLTASVEVALDPSAILLRRRLQSLRLRQVRGLGVLDLQSVRNEDVEDASAARSGVPT